LGGTSRGYPRPDEEKHLAAVHDDQAREEVPLERTDGQRRIGTESVRHAIEQVVDSGRDTRPRPVDEPEERVTDGEAQPWLGHSVSETTLTMTPAMAAARPLRSESFEMTREKKDAVGSAMVGNLRGG